jgi:Holliday junction DNA helicase RuvB
VDEPAAPAEAVSHRPVRFSEIVGQPKLIMRLETHLKVAVARGAQPGHILLDGGPGLGKTTIAQAIVTELNERGMPSRFHEITADAISNARKLALELAKVGAGDVFFVDEIQALKPSAQVALLRVMEDGVMFVEGTAKQPAIRFDVPAFTLVAATTHPGKLSAPVRDRFKFTGHLEPYSFDDLQLVVLSYGERVDIKMEFEAAELIARAARYTPRIATRLVDSVRDYAYEVTGDFDAPIDEETARQGLEYAGIDRYGLDDRDRRYLHKLCVDFLGGPIGKDALMCTLNVDKDELEIIESYLLTAGLLDRHRTGRCATRATYIALGFDPVPPVLNGLR